MPSRPSNTSRSLLCFPALLLICSCSSDAPDREWAGLVLDSAGIRVVHNPEEGLWTPEEAWEFSEALRIGADVGDPNYEFGTIASIQVSPEGLIFVFDRMASEVRVFDQEGRYVRTVGRRGEGPGEFSSGAAGAFLMDDGRVVIPDPVAQRISSMSPEGEFLGSVAVSYASGFPVRWDSDGRGNVFVQRRAMAFNEDADLEAGDPLVRIGPGGEEETLVILPKAETVWMEGPTPRFRYFATEPSWDIGPSGILRTAMTQEYRIEFRGVDGNIQSIVTKPFPRRPVTDQHKARFDELMRRALERRELSPSAIQRQLDNMDFGTTFPAFNQLMEGPEGTTIVQTIEDLDAMESLDLSEEMSRRLGARTWEAFDAHGRFLGTFDFPARFTPMAWEPNAVYGRWLDDLDRAHVLKLNLQTGG